MKPFKMIVACSLNKVIGFRNTIPWHIPEDLKWFRKMTLNQTIVMGRKTFESIGKPLPKRQTVVLSRQAFVYEGVEVIQDLKELERVEPIGDIWICGGGQIYEIALPLSSDLYLTWVKQECEGDTFFPPFEHFFQKVNTLEDTDRYTIMHYQKS